MLTADAVGVRVEAIGVGADDGDFAGVVGAVAGAAFAVVVGGGRVEAGSGVVRIAGRRGFFFRFGGFCFGARLRLALLRRAGFGGAVASPATAGGVASFAAQAGGVASGGTTSCFALKMCLRGFASARAGIAWTSGVAATGRGQQRRGGKDGE